MEPIVMADMLLDSRTRAIVCFGPATAVSGMRAGEYYQVVIDPDMASPGGEYIRFNQGPECELHGWQRISALTICEVLEVLEPAKDGQTITMRAIAKD